MTPSDLLQPRYLGWVIGLLLLLSGWLLYRVLRRRGTRLDQVLDAISFDRVQDLVLPNGDEGEIFVNRLLLTSQGLLVLEVKEVQGTVFGSDKMQDWTVIATDRRYTFPNPQPALYDRIAAVRAVVRQVPVSGRILFLDGAEFPKGVPSLVTTLDQLAGEFGEASRSAAEVKVHAFRPHWDAIRARSAS